MLWVQQLWSEWRWTDRLNNKRCSCQPAFSINSWQWWWMVCENHHHHDDHLCLSITQHPASSTTINLPSIKHQPSAIESSISIICPSHNQSFWSHATRNSLGDLAWRQICPRWRSGTLQKQVRNGWGSWVNACLMALHGIPSQEANLIMSRQSFFGIAKDVPILSPNQSECESLVDS